MHLLPALRTENRTRGRDQEVTDYSPVQKALAAGAQPAMLCATCPWDRMCITPPTMTTADIEAKMSEAARQDDERLAAAQAVGKPPEMPVGSLMTALVYAGKDTSAQVCPVFALRLRSSGGRQIADATKATMQGWDDER